MRERDLLEFERERQDEAHLVDDGTHPLLAFSHHRAGFSPCRVNVGGVDEFSIGAVSAVSDRIDFCKAGFLDVPRAAFRDRLECRGEPSPRGAIAAAWL